MQVLLPAIQYALLPSEEPLDSSDEVFPQLDSSFESRERVVETMRDPGVPVDA